jgi:hypothetical protein
LGLHRRARTDQGCTLMHGTAGERYGRQKINAFRKRVAGLF